MKTLPHVVERSIVIEAERETVFRFFTDSKLWAKWWGAGSSVEPRVGGAIRVVHSNGFISTGEVLEVHAPELFVFTFSMQAAQPVLAEDSRVTMRLEALGDSTRVSVRHELADPEVAKLMPQGWRFHFSLFANAVADYVHRDAEETIDRWFELWTTTDEGARRAALSEIAEEKVQFQDRYSALEGIEEIITHVGASLRFMPGVLLERRGLVRHCQGTVLAGFAIVKDGSVLAEGTNVFRLSPASKIASVVGVRN